MKDFGDGRVARVVVLVCCLFLAAPLLVVVGSSVTSSSFIRFPPDGFTLEPYRDIQNHAGFGSSTVLSLVLAVLVAVVSTVIALLTSHGLAVRRREGRRSGALDVLFLAPLMIPHVVLGIGLFQVFQGVGIAISFWTLMIAHIVITIPYGVRILSTAEAGIDPNTQRAAENLGASGLEVYLRVVLPQLRPALVATVFLAATVSLGEVGASLFLANAETMTLPVRMFNFLQYQASPFISAIGTLLILVPLAIALLAEKPFGLARLFGIKAGRS